MKKKANQILISNSNRAQTFLKNPNIFSFLRSQKKSLLHLAAVPFSFLWRWLLSCNHNKIAALYFLLGGFFWLGVGLITLTIFWMAIHSELFQTKTLFLPNNWEKIINFLIVSHAFWMCIIILTPILFLGFGNFFLKLITKSSQEDKFPQNDSISFLLLPNSVALIVILVLVFPQNLTADIVIFSLNISGCASILGAMNFVIIALNLRLPDILFLYHLPLPLWSLSLVFFLLLISLPVFVGVGSMLLGSVNFLELFYKPFIWNPPCLYKHLFWFFGHPESCVLILPVFGLLSIAIARCTSKPVFGYVATIFSVNTVGFAVLFTAVQYFDYCTSSCGTTFFLNFGFHGFCVIMGIFFNSVSFLRLGEIQFITPRKQLGFEFAVWYWHFVDVVWLFLFISIYWWGS
jgi:cytochrome c oxidase subunit 1